MTITLPSRLTVGEAAACRAELLEALQREGDLVVDARGLEEVDAAGLQVLEAVHRTLLERGKRLRFAPGGRGAIDTVAPYAGLRLAADPLLWRESDHA